MWRLRSHESGTIASVEDRSLRDQSPPEGGPLQRRLVLGLILMGVVARLVPHPPNVTPVMAIALFGGTYLSRRWGIVLPLAVVAISDVLIGWHRTIPFTWGAFALTGTLGWWIRRRLSAARILGGALCGSLLFFVVTNFGVWVGGHLYPQTPAGLWACYVAGIPFFRTMALGDLVYTAALFGGYAAATALRPARQTAGPGPASAIVKGEPAPR